MTAPMTMAMAMAMTAHSPAGVNAVLIYETGALIIGHADIHPLRSEPFAGHFASTFAYLCSLPLLLLLATATKY